MVPTYFRRELRDRALQRPLRLRTIFAVAWSSRGGGSIVVHRCPLRSRASSAPRPGPLNASVS